MYIRQNNISNISFLNNISFYPVSDVNTHFYRIRIGSQMNGWEEGGGGGGGRGRPEPPSSLIL